MRPGMWRGTTTWLTQGGGWRLARAVCGSCGARGGGGVAWSISAGRPRPYTLPLRVLRAVWEALDRQRTAVPNPALYLGSVAGGALVGAGLAAATRSDRRAAGTATGAAAGLVTVWSVFVSTALRRADTWGELRDGVLAQVSPARALRRSQQRQEELARSVTFPVYGLAGWTGPHWLAGTSSSGQQHEPVRVTSLALDHATAREDGPRVRVETGLVDGAEVRDIEQRLADDHFWSRAGPVAPDLLEQRVAAWACGAALDHPPWQDGTLDVAGRALPARRLGESDDWVAYGLVGDLYVVVTAHQVAPEALAPLRVVDVADYRSR